MYRNKNGKDDDKENEDKMELKIRGTAVKWVGVGRN